MNKARIFISYSHKDEQYREELEKHLIMLRRSGLIETWTDRKVMPGQEWGKEIDAKLKAADIILLLVSSDFLASDYCFDVEVAQAMRQHEQGYSKVIPIILRPCDWHDTPFGILQGLPKDGKPIREYSDFDRAFFEVVKGVKKTIAHQAVTPKGLLRLKLVNADIAQFPCDVVVLKYAQHFYGADRFISKLLVDRMGIKLSKLQPDIGQYRVIDSEGHMGCKYVLFSGVQELWSFSYPEISDFSKSAIVKSVQMLSGIRSIAFTIHGTGYGLDELEVLKSQIRGIKQALEDVAKSNAIETIYIVEKDKDCFERLKNYLPDFLHSYGFAKSTPTEWHYSIKSITNRDKYATEPDNSYAYKKIIEEKGFVFVAMPFKKEFDDIFYFGIQGAVHENGLLCERIDQDSFTGEILARILDKIEKAKFIIAELSGANPNVYLEVGYAWGKSKPTILLAKDVKELQFDIRGHKCLSYERIIDLREKLTEELRALNGS